MSAFVEKSQKTAKIYVKITWKKISTKIVQVFSAKSVAIHYKMML